MKTVHFDLYLGAWNMIMNMQWQEARISDSDDDSFMDWLVRMPISIQVSWLKELVPETLLQNLYKLFYSNMSEFIDMLHDSQISLTDKDFDDLAEQIQKRRESCNQ